MLGKEKKSALQTRVGDTQKLRWVRWEGSKISGDATRMGQKGDTYATRENSPGEATGTVGQKGDGSLRPPLSR